MADTIDPLDLSDEDFAALSDEDISAMFEGEAASDDAASTDSDEEVGTDEADDDSTDEDNTSTDDDDASDSDDEDADTDSSDTDATSDSDTDTGEVTDEADEGDTPESDEEDADPEKDTKTGDSGVDLEAFHKQLTAPFRANGKEMQLESAEDIIKLVQMGANYNKKMAALKPNLKLIKMLENNDLLDEDNLSYLIDLQKKDPAAIKKLLKESNTDLLELDLDKEHGYETNKAYTVSDSEVALDGILDDIRDTDSFQQTIDIVSNKWDAESRQILVQNPEVIKVINDHVATGIYDRIVKVMDRERMLGKLEGMSDVDAYKYVGDAINEAGGFDDVNLVEQTPSKDKPTKTVDPKVKQRKKVASSTKPSIPKKKTKTDFDPLAMSDEDFEKMGTAGLF